MEFYKELDYNNGVVVLDIWADWCGPCSYMGPLIEKFAEENRGEVTVLKMNVDKNMGFAQEMNVMDIPTMFVIKGGNIVDSIVGQTPYETLSKKILSHL